MSKDCNHAGDYYCIWSTENGGIMGELGPLMYRSLNDGLEGAVANCLLRGERVVRVELVVHEFITEPLTENAPNIHPNLTFPAPELPDDSG